jgi:hypothetical protein
MEINNNNDDDNISLKSFNSINCSICLESLNNNSTNTTLQCYHTFHTDCINQWNNNTCPLCRTNISSTEITIIMPTYNINLPQLNNEEPNLVAQCLFCICCILIILVPIIVTINLYR